MCKVYVPELVCSHFSNKQEVEKAIAEKHFLFLKKEIDQGRIKSLAKRPKEYGHTLAAESEEITKAALIDSGIAIEEAECIRSNSDFTSNGKSSNSKVSISVQSDNLSWKYGQANCSSVHRLADGIYQGRDNYIIVHNKVWVYLDGSFECTCLIFDLFDYPQFVTANAGPGQMMLREKFIYECGPHVPKGLTEAKDILLDLECSSGEKNLFTRQLQSFCQHARKLLFSLKCDNDRGETRRKEAIDLLGDLRKVHAYTVDEICEWINQKDYSYYFTKLLYQAGLMSCLEGNNFDLYTKMLSILQTKPQQLRLW